MSDKPLRVLNLYAGIGGNRRLWRNVEVTAVENDAAIAEAYKGFYPGDNVVIADAHQYLLENHGSYDVVWSSPPCPSHGQLRYNLGFKARKLKPLFPDFKLYEEIVFLKHYFKGVWAVENVKPYYTPLIAPTVILQRHLFWSNLAIPQKHFPPGKNMRASSLADYDIDLSHTKISNKRQVLRNCVDAELGKYVFKELTTERAAT